MSTSPFDSQNPFGDRAEEAANGPNPFAEGRSTELNPYDPPQKVVDSQATPMPLNRSGVVFALGLLGMVVTGLGFVCCPPFSALGLVLSLPAWIIGHHDLRAIDQGIMDVNGRGLTLAGYILGIIGTIGIVFVMLLGILFVSLMFLTSR